MIVFLFVMYNVTITIAFDEGGEWVDDREGEEGS